MQNKKINALIVDDEQHNRKVLIKMLSEYCPEVSVCGQAANAEVAYELICSVKPDLVFLDIKMPEKSGFDLLRMFDEVKFEVILVSAFNEYAIHAFDFNAVDYILKPIDYTKLIKSVNKACKKILSNEPGDILHFISTLDEATSLVSKLTVHHRGKVIFLNVSEVVSIEAHQSFCSLLLNDNSRYSSTKRLKEFEDVLSPLKTFLRINKSVLVNMNYIKSYTKGETCIIELGNYIDYEVSRRKKTEILNLLNSFNDNISRGPKGS